MESHGGGDGDGGRYASFYNAAGAGGYRSAAAAAAKYSSTDLEHICYKMMTFDITNSIKRCYENH